MGKVTYVYTDSESEGTAVSISESDVKRKRFSFLNYVKKLKKNKCKAYSCSESDDVEYTNKTISRKLRGILKHNYEVESSDDERVYTPVQTYLPKCLIGRVPAGDASSRGSGFAMIIRKTFNKNNTPKERSRHNKRKPSKRDRRFCGSCF